MFLQKTNVALALKNGTSPGNACAGHSIKWSMPVVYLDRQEQSARIGHVQQNGHGMVPVFSTPRPRSFPQNMTRSLLGSCVRRARP